MHLTTEFRSLITWDKEPWLEALTTQPTSGCAGCHDPASAALHPKRDGPRADLCSIAALDLSLAGGDQQRMAPCHHVEALSHASIPLR